MGGEASRGAGGGLVKAVLLSHLRKRQGNAEGRTPRQRARAPSGSSALAPLRHLRRAYPDRSVRQSAALQRG
jgi:hypothetical protein